ncbi:hypothetical protein KIL84_007621 [Mauremys mutica]|uniref:Uncharacterized protein n=1 Tax=Mauremys mutica TaxID=74926 RepID=A0A9D4AV82_9SAUR|nr:hypothetical protein KIL84_007621 [Mauremys mutica]
MFIYVTVGKSRCLPSGFERGQSGRAAAGTGRVTLSGANAQASAGTPLLRFSSLPSLSLQPCPVMLSRGSRQESRVLWTKGCRAGRHPSAGWGRAGPAHALLSSLVPSPSQWALWTGPSLHDAMCQLLGLPHIPDSAIALEFSSHSPLLCSTPGLLALPLGLPSIRPLLRASHPLVAFSPRPFGQAYRA